MTDDERELVEKHAINKKPRKGKCLNSCFANGWHRVGTIPVMSLLDGGLPGDVAKEICLECGKIFENTSWFIPKIQPNRIRLMVSC